MLRVVPRGYGADFRVTVTGDFEHASLIASPSQPRRCAGAEHYCLAGFPAKSFALQPISNLNIPRRSLPLAAAWQRMAELYPNVRVSKRHADTSN